MTATKRTRGLSRREFLRWTGLAGAGLALAACAQPAAPTQAPPPTQAPAGEVGAEPTAVPPTAAPAEPVSLEIWWNNWGEYYNDLMEKLGDSYMQDHPNRKVEWSFSSEWQEKLLARVAAGDPPDATYTNFDVQSALALQNTFMALDEQVAQVGLKREDFVTPMWDASIWEGKLYAIPGGADFICLFYSKTLFKAVGLDPEAPPKTAAELIDQSLKILKKDSAGNIENLGYSPVNWEVANWAYLFGGSWYDEASKKVTADDPKNVEALEWMADYVAKVGADQLMAYQSSQPGNYNPGNPFATGRAAFVFDGFWFFSTLNDLAPDLDYGVAFWPTLNGTEEERKNYMIGGWMVAMPRGAKQVAASWDFIKYGFIDNSWKMGCDTQNGCTVQSEMDQFTKCVTDSMGESDRMTPYFHLFAETGAAGTRYWPSMPANSFYRDETNRAYDYVVRGEKTAKDALAEDRALTQAELDKALAGGGA